MHTLVIILLAVSQFATTFETDHIFFTSKELCEVAKLDIEANLKTQGIKNIVKCYKL